MIAGNRPWRLRYLMRTASSAAASAALRASSSACSFRCFSSATCMNPILGLIRQAENLQFL